MGDSAKAARVATGRRAAQGKDVPVDVAAAAAASKTEAPKDLSDPQTQWKILNPETLGYTLQLEGDPRPIAVRIAFTLRDQLERHLFESVEAFRQLLGVEMMAFNPSYRKGSPIDWDWFREHDEYIDPIVMLPHVRARARAIIAALSTFVDDDRDRAAQRVTPDHLELGMDWASTGAAIFRIMMAVNAEVVSRKKASAAARKVPA